MQNFNNESNASETTTKKTRGRPKGSKNKPKTEETVQNVVYSKPVLAAYNKNVSKSKKPKAKLSFLKGGQYDELEWYRLRMKKNKDNEARLKAERLNKNGSVIRNERLKK